MKILVSLSYYYPNISGLTIYAKILSEELVKLGHEVTVLSAKYKQGYKHDSIENGVRVKRIWTPLIFGRGPLMPTYPLEAFFEVLKCDVINIHTPQFEGFILALIAKMLHKKIVLTHHCDLSGWPGFLNMVSETSTFIALLVMGKLADLIVVYTKDYADNSVYLRRFKNKLVYILPPVKLPQINKRLRKVCEEPGYKIGFAGRIAREKGVEYLFSAIPFIEKNLGSKFKIFLAGPGKEVIGGGYEKDLSELIEKYKKYLVFLGPLDQKHMAMFYNSVDVLVLPSTERLESFGFVQVEAMLSGCPVIASDLPGVRVPIGLSKMGKIVPAGNSEKLVRAITGVLRNKKLYIKAKKQISNIFKWGDTISRYEKIFKSLSV